MCIELGESVYDSFFCKQANVASADCFAIERYCCVGDKWTTEKHTTTQTFDGGV